jgi:hypothetical protein
MKSSETLIVSGLSYRATSVRRIDRAASTFLLMRRFIMLFGLSFAINCLNFEGVTTTGIANKCG